MKKLTTLLLLLTVLTSGVLAQTADVMEKRAREMHKAILSSDKEQWKKFINENYSQALIDKPMRAAVQTDDNGSTTPLSNILVLAMLKTKQRCSVNCMMILVIVKFHH
jgi:hypothetical protein